MLGLRPILSGSLVAIPEEEAVVTDPFVPKDWPNPRAAKISVFLKTHIDTVRLNLIGQDQIFGAPGQVPTYDWQNPKRPRRSIELLTFLNTFIPPPAVALPPGQQAISSPIFLKKLLPDWIRGFSDGLPITQLPPASQRVWPLPLRPQRPYSLLTSLSTFIPPAPVGGAARTFAYIIG